MVSLDPSTTAPTTIVLGGGPAGVTAAYGLARAGVDATLIERQATVGGISRTPIHNGYRFDLGGHRFFTKSQRVEELWKQTLGEDLLVRERLSRIYYGGKLFHYPLRPMNALLGLSLYDSVTVLASYAKAQILPKLDEKTLEDWVCNRFGRRLYEIFFESYTEKVWGIPCAQIDADWAAQRIRGLSLSSVLGNAFRSWLGLAGPTTIKTLIERFHYPRQGPGMMWDALARRAEDAGSRLLLRTSVVSLRVQDDRVEWVEVDDGESLQRIEARDVISSIPLRELIERVDPPAPAEVRAAAGSLTYRDFLTVVLIVDAPDVFDDNWIYVHEPRVQLGRIQNFKNWSPSMVPDPDMTCLGLEYFCFEGDALWTMPDEDLVALGTRELAVLGLVRPEQVVDGVVVRVPKAYPVYDPSYRQRVAVVREYVDRIANLQVVGRNGMHRYNNQDHSMLTAMQAVDNVLGAEHDLWAVNADDDYHEEVLATADEVRRKTFRWLDPRATGVATGLTLGLLTLIATAWATFAGGRTTDPGLGLISEYFLGYSVTPLGAFIGAGHSLVWGFVIGWLLARLRNGLLALGLHRDKRRLELQGVGEAQAEPPSTAAEQGREHMAENFMRRAMHLHTRAIALACGSVCATIVFTMTLWLVLDGGHVTVTGDRVVGPHLALLGEFFIGYRVTILGSIIGGAYGFMVGAAAGALMGWLYNKVAASWPQA